ncbi:competence type IV pilus minor pilin ComGD [Bacillus sp. NEB1478]|uniref:competence type IV pilus minor pilin ComGD n=1 Tax=Bacillus sp. NEB1478 TaxID=3073816 RepID=UPI002873E089|nr:competence type IV pilus minor pilin ComGD [Bacillus sp. NEB1478]WNB93558.1 competence type IV pilus minor pilin ComGD [Bacillus sp. NEB1478]
MKLNKGQYGFSLIEMMIVLLIISIMVTIAFPKFDAFQKNRKTEYFIASFQKDLLHIQQRAILEGSTYRLIINNENHFYEIRGYKSGQPVKKYFPEFITFVTYSMSLIIQYNQFGNINRAGTLYINSGNQTYKMVFQIGKGKFNVSKQ